MKNEMDDLLNSVFGSRRTLSPTSETLPELHADPVVTPAAALDTLQKNVSTLHAALDTRLAQQQKEIEQLNQTALDDIARIKREITTPAVQNLATQPAAAPVQPGAAGVGAQGFDGLALTLEKTVLGQTNFLQKLVIALKRPYVMGHIGESARGAIVVTGPACTGKHLALTQAAAALKTAGVLASSDLAWVDLSLYPSPSEEKLFLQDLYMALASSAELVVFTHYESCHSGFLPMLRDLVQKGKSPLASRYVLQNGRLIEAGTALVSDAVSALTPRGKYLIFLTTQPMAKVADRFGAPFVSALGDICETAPLNAAALAQIAEAQFLAFQQKAKTALSLTVSASKAALALAWATPANGGAQNVLLFFEKTYKALAQYKLEHEDGCPAVAALDVENDTLTVRFDGQVQPLFSLLPQEYQGAVAQVKAEFDAVIGLTEIKQYIISLEDNFTMQARRKKSGLKTASVSMHMIFTGNPGTGKTTIARLVSQYLKSIGVLSGGQLVEVTRADLVGKYVGHTAPLTTQVMKSALGGVLFIDEAYSLYRGKDDSFGLEAIDTLVKGMEDNRDNLLVILAGYSKEMTQFFTANSGLKSRFPNVIEFPDYSGKELLDITKLQAKSKGYVLEPACDSVLLAYYNATQLQHAREAGNGRLARNKVEQAILNQARRLAKDVAADLSLLCTQDFELNDISL